MEESIVRISQAIKGPRSSAAPLVRLFGSYCTATAARMASDRIRKPERERWRRGKEEREWDGARVGSSCAQSEPHGDLDTASCIIYVAGKGGTERGREVDDAVCAE